MDTLALADGFRILKGFATEMFVKRTWSMQDKQSACSTKRNPIYHHSDLYVQGSSKKRSLRTKIHSLKLIHPLPTRWKGKIQHPNVQNSWIFGDEVFEIKAKRKQIWYILIGTAKTYSESHPIAMLVLLRWGQIFQFNNWVFPKIGVFPQNGWFIMENPIKMG